MIDKKLQAVIARILTVAMDGIGLEQDAVARAIQQYEGQAIPLTALLLEASESWSATSSCLHPGIYQRVK